MTMRCWDSASQNGAVVGVLTGIGRSKLIAMKSSLCSVALEDERRLLGQDSAVAGHERAVAVGHLSRTRAPHYWGGGGPPVMPSPPQIPLGRSRVGRRRC